MNTENELAAMQIIMHSGNAKSCCMEAMQSIREDNFEKAKQQLKDADESLNEAHRVQTSRLVDEAKGVGSEYSLLMTHAQDHYMNARTTRDLVDELVFLHEKINRMGGSSK